MPPLEAVHTHVPKLPAALQVCAPCAPFVHTHASLEPRTHVLPLGPPPLHTHAETVVPDASQVVVPVV
jgi:hypothetical protein